MPTQIVWESTTRLSDDHSRDLEHEADVAWNLFTAIYFKADGFPWSPVGLPGGTCFVGIDFYRPQGDATTVQASLAQAFAETGDAFVLRGSEFRWDWKDRSPHVPANQAAELITAVRDHYERHFRRQPRHVVVHKRTYFDAAEREGFQDAMSGVEYDLVAVRPANNMRLLRNGEYPHNAAPSTPAGTAHISTQPEPSLRPACIPTVTFLARSTSPTTLATAPTTSSSTTSCS